MWSAVVPVTPSSARAIACSPYSRAVVRPGLHVRLVDLHDVGAGGEEVLDLLVHRRGVAERHLLGARVEVVLRLLRHRERTGHGHLHRPVGVRPEDLEVAELHRMPPPDRADDPRHRVRVTAAVERGPRVVDVDAVQRGGEAVGVALPAHLAVGEDVEPGPFLVADGEDGGVVLGLLQPLRGDPPQLAGPHPRREAAGQPRPVDQPVRLGVRTDERCREELRHRQSELRPPS